MPVDLMLNHAFDGQNSKELSKIRRED